MKSILSKWIFKSGGDNRLVLILLCLATVVSGGCGGGGGGGGGTPPSGNPTTPVQSNWSPAKETFLTSSSVTLTFQTDRNATCRWSLSDAAYDSMAGACSGTANSHSCNVSGLSGADSTVYLACVDTAGNKDTAASNTHVHYNTDSTPPSIQFAALSGGSGPYSPQDPPKDISLTFSDTGGSGIAANTLEVKYTLLGRAIDVSDLFTTGASSATIDQSVSAPLWRTSLSGFQNAVFSADPVQTWTVDRCSDNIDDRHISSDGSDRIYFWDNSCDTVRVIQVSTGAAGLVKLPSGKTPAAVAGGSTTGNFYVAVKDDALIYVYDSATLSLKRTLSLSSGRYPVSLAFDNSSNMLYAAYKAQSKVGRFFCGADSENTRTDIDVPSPESLAPWSGDGFLAIGWHVNFKLYQINSSGGTVNTFSLGENSPLYLTASPANSLAFVSRWAAGDTLAINVSTNTTTTLNIGSGPRGVFTAGAQALVTLPGGDSTAPSISLIGFPPPAAAGNISLNVPATGGVYINGYYFLLEDVWQIQHEETVSLTATIKDGAGNTSNTATLNFSIKRTPAPGGG